MLLAHSIKYARLANRIHRRFSSSARLLAERPKNIERKAKPASIQQETKPIRSSDRPFDDILPRHIAPEDGTYGALGEEISGSKIDGAKLITKLNEFYQLQEVRDLAASHLINEKLFAAAFISFRRYCHESIGLSPELHIKICDIIAGHGHVSDLFPFFLSHARSVYPHLECHKELREISNLTLPHNWYPEARKKQRKIIFHAGPTNSGKTYHAMRRFLESKSGIYCGPLKLLAAEIHQKAMASKLQCDLVTGEEIIIAHPDGETRSPHVSCTVEMTNISEPVEVVVLDEIQMIQDPGRGWAWTRALLGAPADEVHLCGEDSAIDVIKKVLEPTLDILEVRRYKRLTPLVVEDEPLLNLRNVRSGDCVVCFNKDSIYRVSIELERLGHDVSVVYGALPPGVKLAQCRKFNDQAEGTVLVATDAIGMGLNLSIGRIIFFSLMKTNMDRDGNRNTCNLTTSQCLQIAGRAGRFNTKHSTGYVTTFKAEDLIQLKEIMAQEVPPVEQAGLHPTADQLELFGFHLPHLNLVDLIELFEGLCQLDAQAYFMCDMESLKNLAKQIQGIELPLRSRFVFCCAPINTKFPFSVAMFTKLARQFSLGEPVTVEWLKNVISWPYQTPQTLDQLVHLEQVFDTFECYLWLSYRFPIIFPDREGVRGLQRELDSIIHCGVSNLVKLIRAVKKKPPAKRPAFSVVNARSK